MLRLKIIILSSAVWMILGIIPAMLTAEPTGGKVNKEQISGAVHFPPFQYDPEYTTSDRPGIIAEMFAMTDSQLGPKGFTRKFFPPSRLVQMVKEGKVAVFTLASFQVDSIRDSIKNKYYCNQTPFIIKIVLYQNLAQEPEVKDMQQELRGKNILIPKESKALFEKLIPPGNNLIEVVAPENMGKMFIFQRAPFMIDYDGRANEHLQGKSLPFKYKAYPLREITTSLCMRYDIPRAQLIVDDFIKELKSFRNRPELKQLEQKYHYRINWMGEEDSVPQP